MCVCRNVLTGRPQLQRFQSVQAWQLVRGGPISVLSTVAMSRAADPEIQRILLSFWYDRNPREWFQPPAGFDAECATRFGELVAKARAGGLDDWAAEPESCLALLLLLDQLTRNIFRGTPDAFSSDTKAADIATRAIARGFDKQVTRYQALQYFLPLMHQESLLAQVASLSLLENLRAALADDAEERAFVDQGIRASRLHLDVIARFGRYPSRNAILGRQATEAELRFLQQYPSGFPPIDLSP